MVAQIQRGWTPKPGFFPALSVQQPFAKALLHVASASGVAAKQIELRTWPTKYRGWLLIHAGKSYFDGMRRDEVAATLVRLGMRMVSVSGLARGAVVGMAWLEWSGHIPYKDWERLRPLHRSNGEWRANICGWKFSHPVEFATPLPANGALGLFPVAAELLPPSILRRLQTETFAIL